MTLARIGTEIDVGSPTDLIDQNQEITALTGGNIVVTYRDNGMTRTIILARRPGTPAVPHA